MEKSNEQIKADCVMRLLLWFNLHLEEVQMNVVQTLHCRGEEAIHYDKEVDQFMSLVINVKCSSFE